VTIRQASLQSIPDGVAGTKATLNIMRRFVREYKKSLPVRELALSLVRPLPGHKNWVGQIKALHRYVQKRIQYVRDIRGVETIATPLVTIQSGQGDCDDQAVLLAALLESIGHRTRFVAIRQTTFGPFVHVFTEAKIGSRWIPLETTENMRAGAPMRFAGRLVVNN
jgi:transglutaminase-like putative cysteine protease